MDNDDEIVGLEEPQVAVLISGQLVEALSRKLIEDREYWERKYLDNRNVYDGAFDAMIGEMLKDALGWGREFAAEAGE